MDQPQKSKTMMKNRLLGQPAEEELIEDERAEIGIMKFFWMPRQSVDDKMQ